MSPTWRGWLLLGLLALPWLGALAIGLWWLWAAGWWLPWLLAVTLTILMLSIARHWQQGQFLHMPPPIEGNPLWSPQENTVWTDVCKQADILEPEAYPLDSQLPQRLLDLGLTVGLDVARRYYPESKEPRLAVPVPQLLHSAEKICRDLRQLSTQIPLSHSITAENLLNIKDYYQRYGDHAKNALRFGSLFLNPQTRILGELRQYLLGRAVDFSRKELLRWLLRNYVREAGRYAIDLYSGHQQGKLSPEFLVSDNANTEKTETNPEPLRILVLGRSNSGKSSLINALFGGSLAATDILPNPSKLTPYQLKIEGFPAALIFDSAGYDKQMPENLEQELGKADMVLLVANITEAARQPDRDLLRVYRQYFAQRPQHAPPLLLSICSHIDRISPAREWSPPYNIAQPQTTKEQNIRAALETVGTELALPLTQIIPAVLLPDRLYNVEEAIIPAVLEGLPDARRTYYLRCLQRQKNVALWQNIRTQAIIGGRFIAGAAEILAGSVVKRKRGG